MGDKIGKFMNKLRIPTTVTGHMGNPITVNRYVTGPVSWYKRFQNLKLIEIVSTEDKEESSEAVSDEDTVEVDKPINSQVLLKGTIDKSITDTYLRTLSFSDLRLLGSEYGVQGRATNDLIHGILKAIEDTQE